MPKYIVEIASPRNQSAIFQPTKQRLRGRWDNAHVAHLNRGEANAELAREAGTIPGIWIALDTETKRGEILDPLKETQEGRALMEKMNSILARYKYVTGGEKKPWDTSKHTLNVDGVKEWAFFMRQLIDDKLAIAVQGSDKLPTTDEIREWPGRRRRDPFNDGPQTAKSQEHAEENNRLYKWADERAAGGKKEKKDGELAGTGAGAGGGVKP